MTEKSGSFGTVTYSGNSMNIEIDTDSLGSIALTSGEGRIECYWDGNEWVCQAVSFYTGTIQAAQAPKAV
ncbi:MAG: hypothetical protein C5B55_04785 [Blastocatellia bacterium]|nr:MAG: hypothetical protein C5B55_04785 [Blastocatellia bacterium]